MTYSISKILEVHIDDSRCTVTAILEDMVQVSPASSWSDPPQPAEYGPATCIGGFDIDDYILVSYFSSASGHDQEVADFNQDKEP